MNRLGFLLADLDDAVEDEARADTVGDAVAQSHEHTGKECRNGFGEISPFDLGEGRSHHDTDDDQGRSGCSVRNRADKGGKKCAQGKADGDNNAGQSRASAGADACCAFYIGCGVGGTENSTDGSCRCIGKERLVHLGMEAAAAFHGLFVFLAEDTAAAAGADEGTDRIKGIRQAECEDRDQNQRDLGGIGKQGAETSLGEDRAEGGGKRRTCIREADGLRHSSHAERNTDQSGHDDADQDRALHMKNLQNDDQEQSNQKYPENRLVHRGKSRNARLKVDETDIDKAQIGDEKTDAAADRVLQADRDSADDVLSDLGDGDDDVNQTADEDHRKCLLPGELEAETDRENKERIQAHARCLCVRNVSKKTHNQRSDDGCDDGRKEDRAPFHAGLTQHGRIDHDDVSHCKERGQARNNFG